MPQECVRCLPAPTPTHPRPPTAGFEPDKATVALAQAAGVSKVSISHDPFEAVKGADVIYTGRWGRRGGGGLGWVGVACSCWSAPFARNTPINSPLPPTFSCVCRRLGQHGAEG